MPRFELTLSPDYVKDWGIREATRELFQNALDQQTIDPSNKMSWNYNVEDRCLIISSHNSTIPRSSLLLGNSTKSDNNQTIGKFGEGYKLALLVLTRLGHKVTVYNYGAKEKWVPKIINSKRYSSKLLVIDIERYIFKSVPDNNLSFVIEDIEISHMTEIREATLFMYELYESYKAPKGEILLDKKHKGRVFVNGLFVCSCNDKTIRYGYNVKPEQLNLDRDRSLIDSFNLTWLTSEIWGSYPNISMVSDLVDRNVPDVKYINNFNAGGKELSDMTFERFRMSNDPSCIPVSDQVQYNKIKKDHPGLTPIYVSTSKYSIMSRASRYSSMLITSGAYAQTPEETLDEFATKYFDDMTDEMISDFNIIIRKSKLWR